jgi:hypothetical protein
MQNGVLRIEETDMKTSISLAIALVLFPLLAAAQNPIYQSTDKAGPVFSDTPTPGATQVDLQPINVIQTPKVAPSSQPPQAPAAAYGQLLITSPANGDTFWLNSGNLQVQIYLNPQLNSTLGHTVRLRVNGRLLPRSFTSNTVNVTQGDFNLDTRNDNDNIEQTVQAVVVDAAGKVLIESPSISLFLRRHIQYNRATPRQ